MNRSKLDIETRELRNEIVKHLRSRPPTYDVLVRVAKVLGFLEVTVDCREATVASVQVDETKAEGPEQQGSWRDRPPLL